MDKLEKFAIVIEVCLSMGAVVSAFWGFRWVIVQGRVAYAVKRIANTDKDKRIPVNAIELRHTIHHYVKQVFKVDTYIDSSVQSQFLPTSKVIRDIIKSLNSFEYSLYCISGGPAIGKSVALRYIFCKLAKRKPCFYFPMRAYNSLDELKDEIKIQINQIPKRYLKASKIPTAVAFFDGVDEAYSLITSLRIKARKEGREEDPLFDLFLSSKPMVCGLFKECGLNQPTIVISVRPEVLEDGIRTFREAEGSNARITVCELQKMGYHIVTNKKTRTDYLKDDRKYHDIIKMYRLLQLLQKAEIKAECKRIKGKIPRHSNRFPPKDKRKDCLIFLTNCLDASKDSLFRYPMFIRYVYPLYKNLIEENRSDNVIKIPDGNDFYASFDILVDSIAKWEFHEYSNEKAKDDNGNDTHKYSQFKSSLFKGLESIAKSFLECENMKKFENRDTIKGILDDYLPESKIADENIYIAHSLMICDESGKIFDFVHTSFFEYFAAKYLFSCNCNHNNDTLCDGYQKRKTHLSNSKSSGILYHYFSLLCNDEYLSHAIATSLGWGKCLNSNYISKIIDEEYVSVIDEPTMIIWKIFQYLPIIKGFKYHGFIFTSEAISKLVDEPNYLSLSNSHWTSLEHIAFVVPYSRIKYLIIINTEINIENNLHVLIFLSLEWLAVYATNDSQIEILYDKNTESQFAKKIWVSTSDYNPVLIKIYEKNECSKSIGNKCTFAIWRTKLEKAEERFSCPKADDITLMKAVFELESDDEGIVDGSNSEQTATLWNGLTLARCYEDKDPGDVDGNARDIYERLAKHLANKNRNNKIGVYFGYYNGKNLLLCAHYKTNAAKLWLNDAYKNAREQISARFAFDCGCSFLKACIRCGDDESLNTAKELIQKLTKSADDLNISRTNSNLMQLLQYQIGYYIKLKHKYKNLLQYAKVYLKAGEEYAEKYTIDKDLGKRDKYYIFDANYYHNVIFVIAHKYQDAFNSIKDMSTILVTESYSCSNRVLQSMQIKYTERKMITLFLLKRFDEAKEVALEHMVYPHRTEELSLNAARYIVCKCDGNDEELNAHSEYEKQFTDLIKGDMIWL